MAGCLKGSMIIGGALAGVSRGLASVLPARERIKALAYAAERVAPVATLPTPSGPIRFACRTRAAARMPLSFFHHEPETRDWLDAHVQPGQVLWDVGANIGHFTLYAAKARGARVLAFEPSAETFGLLSHNIALNGVGELAQAYCVALSDETVLGRFYLTDPTAGAAMHAYGAAVNVSGDFSAAHVQAVMAFRGDDFAERFAAPMPDHLKIDVDGSEPKVLAGLRRCLGNARSVLIECDGPASALGREIDRLMAQAGFEEDRSVGARSAWNRLYFRPAAG